MVTELASNCDILIEGFAPGRMNEWDLGYEGLQKSNPGLVYCSINGFGSHGDYSHLRGYDGVVATKCGAYNFGPFGFRPGPIFYSAPLASVGAGVNAVSGVLAALVARLRSGRGQHVESTMLQALTAHDYFGTMTYQVLQRESDDPVSLPPTTGAACNRFFVMVPAGDGRWMALNQLMPRQVHALCRAIGLGATITDSRFARQPFFDSAEDAQAWEDLVWEAIRRRSSTEWEKIFLDDPDIAFELVRTATEGLAHPQIVHNGEVVTVQDPAHGPVTQVGPMANFSRTPLRIERTAPTLGSCGEDVEPSRGVPVGAGESPQHALSGVTILELGYFYAMPFGVTLAASLGARVIKIEDERGDPMRSSFGAPEVGGVKTTEGKESFGVDLRTPEGRELVHRLIADADVFVNGFRPGVAERLGLGYEACAEIAPELVYVHAAGYGTDGPYADRAIFAQPAQCVAGSTARFGGKWADPELAKTFSIVEAQALLSARLRGPMDGDANAALTVCASILLGLYSRRKTGKGQFLSTTMIGGNALAYSDDFVDYAGKPPLPRPDDESHGLHPLYRLYRTADGWIFLAARSNSEWSRLTNALGRPDLAEVSEFRTDESRTVHAQELETVLQSVFASDTATAWEKLLAPQRIGCVAAPAGRQAEVTCTDQRLRELGYVVEVDHPHFGRILRHGLPVSLSETPGRVAPSCVFGEHTDAVLRDLGVDEHEIADLHRREVVFGPKTR